eukprot:gene13875-15323_t
MSGKKYGLIIPKSSSSSIKGNLGKSASIFQSEDSDNDEKKKKAAINKELNILAEKKKQTRQTKGEIEKAIKEDPNVYQYDEIYDQMEEQKIQVGAQKMEQNKKPKYIANLLKSAEFRKREEERRIERKVDKERQKEGDEFADKEAFVTSAYRQKMIERAEEEERLKRQEAIDAANDVTKMKDLSKFYRHLLDRNVSMGAESKENDDKGGKPAETKGIKEEIPNSDSDEGGRNGSSDARGRNEACGGKKRFENDSRSDVDGRELERKGDKGRAGDRMRDKRDGKLAERRKRSVSSPNSDEDSKGMQRRKKNFRQMGESRLGKDSGADDSEEQPRMKVLPKKRDRVGIGKRKDNADSLSSGNSSDECDRVRAARERFDRNMEDKEDGRRRRLSESGDKRRERRRGNSDSDLDGRVEDKRRPKDDGRKKRSREGDRSRSPVRRRSRSRDIERSMLKERRRVSRSRSSSKDRKNTKRRDDRNRKDRVVSRNHKSRSRSRDRRIRSRSRDKRRSRSKDRFMSWRDGVSSKHVRSNEGSRSKGGRRSRSRDGERRSRETKRVTSNEIKRSGGQKRSDSSESSGSVSSSHAVNVSRQRGNPDEDPEKTRLGRQRHDSLSDNEGDRSQEIGPRAISHAEKEAEMKQTALSNVFAKRNDTDSVLSAKERYLARLNARKPHIPDPGDDESD